MAAAKPVHKPASTDNGPDMKAVEAAVKARQAAEKEAPKADVKADIPAAPAVAPMTQEDFEARLAAMQQELDDTKAMNEALVESNNNAGHKSVVKSVVTLADGVTKLTQF